VERRLAVHAGAAKRLVAVALALLVATPAAAAPRKGKARALFDRGVKAYQTGDYAAAAAALDESYAIEKDVETLYAWAQAERKLEHCDRAIALWEKLLALDLPAKNKQAIQLKIDDCSAELAKQQAIAPKPGPAAKPEPSSSPEPAAAPDEPAAGEPGAAATTATADLAPRREPPPESSGRSRWKNPIGLSLIGVGVIGLGAGTVFLLQARSADAAKDDAATLDEFLDKRDEARSKGTLSIVGYAAGAVLIGGGIAWILTRPDGERAALSGWIAPDGGGGVVLSGGF
jgi:tetratricopeptide (TPR) repeat protein